MFQWRKFQFFDKQVVTESDQKTPHVVFQKLDVTSCSSGRGHLIFGDNEGFLNIVDREYHITSFQAYDSVVTHVQQLKQRSLLVTIGEDADGPSGVVKIWKLDKSDKNGNPTCLRSWKIFGPKMPPVKITCFAVVEDLSVLAVGLENGAVLLFRGDLSRDRTSKSRVIQAESEFPVTGLWFLKEEESVYTLFTVTTNETKSYRMSSKDDKILPIHLDDQGSTIGCSTLSDDNELAIGRDEAVYLYKPDDKGSCYVFEGNKRRISWFRGYLIVVFEGQTQKNTISIYDLKNKFMAYSAAFDKVEHIVSEWGSIFIVCEDRKVYQLSEKDTQTKLESLFKRNLYQVAINLAISQQFDQSYIVDIYRKYGDHLYSKGDFDGAITQYVHTIGQLEPSYVIRKFLDAQRIHNLTRYLEDLHERKPPLASKEHTTLLLNCYTKLKDVQKLDEFIKTDSLHFEKETAIRVSRQAGYFEHALYLAKKHAEHDWYLKISLEDIMNFPDAIQYISTLDFYEAERYLKKYGKVLLDNVPNETTKLLENLCTDYVRKGGEEGGGTENEAHSEESSKRVAVKGNPEEFIHIFVGQPQFLTEFLEFMVHQEAQPPLVYNTLLELYLRDDDIKDILVTSWPQDIKENGSEYEAIVSQRRSKALKLLQNEQVKYDLDHALLLVQMYNFKQGMLVLYEKLKLYQEIMAIHIESGDNEAIIKACRRYGDKEPDLWVQVLTYFVNSAQNCEKQIQDVLQNIDRDNLLSPLIVVQILSQNPNIKLGVVKDYLTRRMQQENQLIAEDQRTIRKAKDEIEKMRQEIDDLQTKPRVFQKNKCEACTGQLELPSVHFLCMHSYHQRCLGEADHECAKCASKNNNVIEMKRSMEQSSQDHEQFFRQLEGSQDGFTTVSEYFGRGLFHNAPPPSSAL